MKHFQLFSLVLVSLFILGCKSDKPSQNIVVKSRDYSVPSFNQDSAYVFVKKQVDFGPRVPGTEAHSNCADWLKTKMTKFGLDTKIQTFTAKRYDGLEMIGKNVMGRLNPKVKNRIFISAHWDSRFHADHDDERKSEPILGADDGASGVGVCLEIARILAATPEFKMGLDVVLFDLEDQGEDGGEDTDSWGIGSQRWSNKVKSTYNPEYGILLDMVGTKDAKFYKERYSVQTAPMVVLKVWKVAEELGYGHIFLNQEGRGVVDDHFFVNRNTGWPVIDIIFTDNVGANGFGDHWHTHDDNMDVIDKKMLGIVGRVVTKTLVLEDLNRI